MFRSIQVALAFPLNGDAFISVTSSRVAFLLFLKGISCVQNRHLKGRSLGLVVKRGDLYFNGEGSNPVTGWNCFHINLLL